MGRVIDHERDRKGSCLGYYLLSIFHHTSGREPATACTRDRPGHNIVQETGINSAMQSSLMIPMKEVLR